MKTETVQEQLNEYKADLARKKNWLAGTLAATAVNGVIIYAESVIDSPIVPVSVGVGVMTAIGSILLGIDTITTGQTVAALEGAVAQHQLSQEV